MNSKENSPEDTEMCGVYQIMVRGVLSRRHVRQRGRRFEVLQGKAFWFGSVAGGAVTVTTWSLCSKALQMYIMREEEGDGKRRGKNSFEGFCSCLDPLLC